jgi:hypothetical protein
MLSEKDKEILKNGDFMEQTSLLIDHFNDESKGWVKEAREYFRKSHPNIKFK